MFKRFAVLHLCALCLLINGCSSILGATTDEPIDMDPNRRSLGTSIDDTQIETIAKVNLDMASADLKSAPISITSYNRVVLLTGQVKNNEARELAANTVGKLSKVRQVHNELQVQAPISFVATMNDAWLTSKIKTKLLTAKGVDSNRIKVVTENSTVFFMGMIPRSEAEKVADIARKTSGVQKVVLAIEYIDAI